MWHSVWQRQKSCSIPAALPPCEVWGSWGPLIIIRGSCAAAASHPGVFRVPSESGIMADQCLQLPIRPKSSHLQFALTTSNSTLSPPVHSTQIEGTVVSFYFQNDANLLFWRVSPAPLSGSKFHMLQFIMKSNYPNIPSKFIKSTSKLILPYRDRKTKKLIFNKIVLKTHLLKGV